MGYCGHLGQSWFDPPQDVLDALLYVGGKIYRDDFSWGRVEASLGVLAFPGVNTNLLSQDAFITIAQQQDVETLAILDYGNSFYGPTVPAGYKGGLPLTEEERTAFSNYTRYLVSELSGRQVQFELWNEWNVPLGATTAEKTANEHLDPLKYHALQAAAYPALKEANPNAFMWAGGFADPLDYGLARSQWVASYLSIPGWETTVDGFSFHHYFGFRNPEVWFWQVRGVAEQARAASATKPNLPIAVTETGWFNGTDSNSISEEKSAEYYSRWPFLLRCSGINKAVFYDLRNDGPTTGKEDNFGVFYEDYTPKPAAEVLADVLPVIHSCENASYWTDGKRHVVLLDSDKLALWTDTNETLSVTVSVQAIVAGSASLLIAGSTSSSESISVGTTEIVVALSQRSKILTLPANSYILGFE